MTDGTVTEADGEAPDRTLVSLRTVRADDPHLGDAAKHPERTERLIVLVFLVGIAGMIGFGAAYWVAATPKALALTFGVGLFALGFGLTAWGKYLMPRGPFVEDRHVLASSEAEREAISAALVDRGAGVVQRRKVLGGMFGAGVGVFAVVAIFPLLRSLSPKLPGDELEVTDWGKTTPLVDSDGRRIHKDDLLVGGIVTVFPEGGHDQTTYNNQGANQTVLIRLQTTPVTTVPGRESWGPTGYVAYSKACTHLGCPVGLYERELELLVCPCHQSMFNVRDGAVPQFGPAPRPLPQLPLRVDATGFLVSQSGYDQAVGPGFWERTTQGNGKA